MESSFSVLPILNLAQTPSLCLQIERPIADKRHRVLKVHVPPQDHVAAIYFFGGGEQRGTRKRERDGRHSFGDYGIHVRAWGGVVWAQIFTRLNYSPVLCQHLRPQ